MSDTDALRLEIDQLRERVAFLESLTLRLVGGEKLQPQPIAPQPAPVTPCEPWNPWSPYTPYCGGATILPAVPYATVTI